MPTIDLVFAPSNTLRPPLHGITLVVYAPFGTDATLSDYLLRPPAPDRPDEPEVARHPIVTQLRKVADAGVHVCALVDRVDDDTWLLEIPAGRRDRERLTSRGKNDMRSWRTLGALLRHAAASRPGTALVLALEGHGAGFLPDVDFEAVGRAPPTTSTATGAPLLGMGSPLLPGNCPLSTLALHRALADAQARHPNRLAVIHLNNCFNMSVEVLHTIAPFADFATGYMNYNFFSSGQTYAEVFQKIRTQGNGQASTALLARWFATANDEHLALRPQQPTAGGAVQLVRMEGIVDAIEALAAALMTSMTAKPAARLANVNKIRNAIAGAQQYDTVGSWDLEVPDELTDIGSLASRLRSFDGDNAVQVKAAAQDLLRALAGIKVYGVNGNPYVAPERTWNLTGPNLAMNILCPDPLRTGTWDWRSPYYLRQGGTGELPPEIAFLTRKKNWVNFIVEYHRDVPFVALRAATIPPYPTDLTTSPPP